MTSAKDFDFFLRHSPMYQSGSIPMDPIAELLVSYTELNTCHVTELATEPSALEFMRFVALNRPFVVKGAVDGWRAKLLWNDTYFREALENQTVTVAVTPKGNADSPVLDEEGQLRFVKPLERGELFEEFLGHITAQELNDTEPLTVRYAQSQNDNVRSEYAVLAEDIEKDIRWATIALQKGPEAINFWLGNSRSVTALHRDNYENIYCQIIGEKHFVLLPPVCCPCVREQDLSPASYSHQDGGLHIIQEEGGSTVRFPTWDPDWPEERSTKYSHLARPIRITLQPGDMLYLPALWYHKVSQSCSSEGICCAINYWYDMISYSGSFLPYNDFIRNVAQMEINKI